MKMVFGTIAYLGITFPLAYVWHLVLFKATYERLGYFSRTEPIIAFGFLAILLQGMILAIVYPRLCRGKSILGGAVTLALVMGTYHWTIHVLAEAAKHPLEPLPTWFGLETLYLAIQFGLGGLALALIYKERAPGAKVSQSA